MINDATNNNTITTKAKYWVAVGYLENMRTDWQDVIGECLQHPYAYCIHDKDKNSDKDNRKPHVHIMIAFNNTTTYKNALTIFRTLSADGKEAFNTCEKVHNVRFMYDYLIHDTKDCRTKGKHLYSPSERLTGNNFDIGAYEQISVADKHAMLRELSNIILLNDFTNFADFYGYVVSNMDPVYTEIVFGYSGFLERLTKGLYHKHDAQV